MLDDEVILASTSTTYGVVVVATRRLSEFVGHIAAQLHFNPEPPIID
jgi:hypothetical protein